MFPFRREGGLKDNLTSIGYYLDRGMSVLVYPEGTRSRTGEIAPFKEGIGPVVTEMGVAVVPIGLANTHALWPHDRRLPQRGTVRVRFGTARVFEGEDPAHICGELESAVRALL
jgi:1-acyl-sn-glycerol-3-phosphate acyltransferase